MPAATRIALVGCGAVAEQAHLPALRRLSVEPSLLVDPDLMRARSLADRFDVPETATSHLDVVGAAEAAIVAAPNHLHAAISCDLLDAGVHVLVEKPMALTHEDCRRMMSAAERARAVLMVGLRRRFLRSGRWMKRMLESGAIGSIESFDFRNGSVFGWQIASDALWRRDAAGGGVLIDIGSHVLDQVLWWLGPVESIDYRDDAYGGVEADCVISLTLQSGARGTVELSRTRNLRNSAIVRGDAGWIEVALDGNWATSQVGRRPRMQLFRRESWFTPFDLELAHWLGAVEGTEPPIPPSEAAESIRLIESCYATRRPLELPWLATA